MFERSDWMAGPLTGGVISETFLRPSHILGTEPAHHLNAIHIDWPSLTLIKCVIPGPQCAPT